MTFYGFCKIAAQINLKKTLAKSLGTPTASHTRPPEADRWGPRASGPPGRVKARPAALTRPGARGTTRARTRGDGGAKRRGEAGPERAGEGAHGDEEVAASLTGGDAGEEQR